MFDQVAEVHEGGEVRHARGLLHVVGHDRDRVVLLQVLDQLLDAAGGDRVECRGRLVQQQYVGFQRHRARDAQALLLAARQAERALAELVLDLVPQRRLAQCEFDPRGHVGLGQAFVVADRVGDVLEDRHRERHRLLEHHADLAAQAVHRVLRIEDVLAVQQHLAGRGHLRVERIDAVEHAQQRRLATARRSDQRGHALFRDFQVDVLQRLELVVIEVEPARGKLDGRGGGERGDAAALGRGDGDAGVIHGRGPDNGCDGEVSHGKSCCAGQSRARAG